MAPANHVSALSFRAEQPVRFNIAHVEYAALACKEYPGLQFHDDRCPLVILPTDPDTPWSKEALLRKIDASLLLDDVSQPDFWTTLLFWATRPGIIRLPRDLAVHLRTSRIRFQIVELASNSTKGRTSCKTYVDEVAPGGPYLWTLGRLCPIYRLYEDSGNTFTEALQPMTDGTFNPFRAGVDDSRRCRKWYAAIPSRDRVLGDASTFGPLAGKRVLVKDIFDMRGLRTTACNDAYFEMCSTATGTAPMIRRLMQCGAAIIGKSKLSSLISREEPSETLSGYDAPKNPRADGEQSPAGSSSGSAAAIATYEWLDFAIGTDSTGSSRRPAFVNGVFAIRLSTGLLPHEGMMPCFPLFDSPAVFTRDLPTLPEFLRAWCGPDIRNTFEPPTSIVLLQDYALPKKGMQNDLLWEFVTSLERCFNIHIRTLSLEQTWASSKPAASGGLGLREYLHNVGRDTFIYDFYHSTDDFRAKYKEKTGNRPMANLVTTYRWEQAERITPEQRRLAGEKLDVYGDWLRTVLYKDANPIIVLPIMEARPNYRDSPPPKPFDPVAWDQLWLSPILKAPELTLPIGHIPYRSRITAVNEMLPVGASIVGLPGTDLSLIETAKRVLRYSGRPLRVATGRQMFEEDYEML